MCDQLVLKSRLLLAILLIVGVFLLLYFGEDIREVAQKSDSHFQLSLKHES